MFYRGSFFVRFLAALLLISLLIAAGVAVYRVGFNQGYLQGAAVAGADSPLPRPDFPYYPGFYGPRFGFFPFFPLLGILFFGLLFLFLIGGLLRGALFGPRYWGQHGYWHAHPPSSEPPPWERDRPSGESGSPAQPQTRDQE